MIKVIRLKSIHKKKLKKNQKNLKRILMKNKKVKIIKEIEASLIQSKLFLHL